MASTCEVARGSSGGEIAEVDCEQERRVELGLAGDLGQRADLVVPAARPEQLGGPPLDLAGSLGELARAERLGDLHRAARARPVHEHGEAVQPAPPAELPQAGVRLVEARLDLVEERADDLDARQRRDLADEARVEEQAAHREHHLPVDVVLHVLESLVADPHRAVAVVPREVLELPFRGIRGAVDPVGGLEDSLALLGDVAEVLEEPLHLLRMAEPLEGVQREVGVAQPAEAVVPRPSRAGMLGEARRRRGEQRARVLVLVELQRQRGADDLALVVARHPRALHPAAPVVERAFEEALGGLLEARLEGLTPGEDEMAIVLEQERALVLDVRQRDVRRQPDRGGEARVLDVVRRAPRARLRQAVLVRRPAAQARTRLAGERTEDPDEHRRLEEAVVELEAGREVEELELAAGPVEHGPEDVRVLDVLLPHVGRVDAFDREDAASVPVEDRPEDEARVGARPAHPLHRPVAEQRVVRAVADDAEALCHG